MECYECDEKRKLGDGVILNESDEKNDEKENKLVR